MIISRTPFRISFFGGGTDYPQWFHDHKGAVVATTINKYCYITCRYLPPFFKHRSRIIYSQMEHVRTVNEINHPAVREVLNFLHIKQGVEIHHDGDLPARSGLGSSSAFTVGMLNSFYALKGIMPTKEKLAREAISIEQEKCGEFVGCQDQTLAAYGGFNFIEFGGQDHLRVRRITLAQDKVQRLQRHLMLYFTGLSRNASRIARHQVKNIPLKKSELMQMFDMAVKAMDILNGDDLLAFGRLLHESWLLKRSLSTKISNPHIDEIYETARCHGAIGGKLLGAGGGGFMLLFAPPEKQNKIKERLKKLLLIPFKFESQGSQIIFYHPNEGQLE